MLKKIFLGVIAFVVLSLSVRLFCGVYEHDEFDEFYFFIKHRPTWKWRFYSPTGLSDTRMEELSPDKQREQKYFDEFVANRGLSR
jgi:hypothetical protein